ncbi:recombinase family protein [Mycobacterium intracellulare]|uniref:Integrase n=1 Tax=Mycobacterium intracellulare TaxID=1767 RepID=A0A7R7MPG0_MYCIT|nr:recombinase family protein [Mycobacterium intracellulare]BCO97645.1 integrase [Mycobacterium intracellulare]
MTNHRISAAIYMRISQDRTGAGLGVDRQEQECRKLAERLGWKVADVYADNDISAYSGKRRPGYEALLSAIRSGAVHGVLAWHPDRLHRSPRELETYIDACDKHGVETHTVQAGHWDLSTPSGRMVARQLGAVARFESEHKGERIRAARQQQASAGEFHGGIRPYGYEADGVTLRPDEAGELAKAIEQIVSGVSLRAVVRDLNSRGIPTATGRNRWTAVALSETIQRPRTAGLSSYKGEIVGKAKWLAIVPEETWRAACAILTDPARRTNGGRGPGVRWLGSGLYVCGVCGEPDLRVSSRSGRVEKRRAYRCRSRERATSGGHISREATALDAFVEAVIVERLSRPGLVRRTISAEDTTDVAALRIEADAIRQRQEQLAEAFAEGAITRAQLAAGTKKLQQRGDAIDTRLAAAGGRSPLDVIAQAEDIPALWGTLNLGQKRAILDYLCTVTVLKVERSRGAGGFNPEGVRFDWKR